MSRFMNKHTIEILRYFDVNSTNINISNRNIYGILDMSKFKKLIKLNITFNHITKIIGLPDTLETLLCAFNRINYLHDLPFGLRKLVCSANLRKQINTKKYECSHLLHDEYYESFSRNLEQKYFNKIKLSKQNNFWEK